MKHKHTREGKTFNPETLALGYGYDPFLSQGAVKPPVFLTSTFQFQSAEHGKRFFELAYGLRQADVGETPGLIYSRLNNPNLQIFEERISAWDRTETAATFVTLTKLIQVRRALRSSYGAGARQSESGGA